ncbi:dihydrolipoamide acetyltransferase family protein [Prolixibacteraceae bacterium Z1-6]|uniref:Dihydrolipoamide acetyltransferase component of pyruvate dehydrogenase complex n=1 Tax=Draconibacterium aestuarii TaxID=2998507 RepID=A0A9X3F818_9BACT|nr:dihydrolipoamide acetyltransferase family protein [Prolixibacteraceae bacterium Z1-6]
MASFNIVMPKLGESIQEGTITKWFVKEGDTVEEDDMLFEVATDKVDSEIPSPVDGVITKILFPEESLVAVGEVLAVISMDGEEEESTSEEAPEIPESKRTPAASVNEESSVDESRKLSNRFYSPLVKTIAKEENVSLEELEAIEGSGAGGRVQKKDILTFLENKAKAKPDTKQIATSATASAVERKAPMPVSIGSEDAVIEMDRVRKLIADHMVMSKQVSPHVTSVVEADVTELVLWRNKNKNAFQEKYGDKITFMPIFTEAVAAALAEYPLVNSSVDGDKIIMKKNINVGIAVAKPDGNLIVPVIKNAEQKNLVGLSKELNRLANAARTNKLDPSDIQGGTFTITNFGSFGNIIGTPIISQPQVAILATGIIEKKPAVLETPSGDVIAIRHKMYLSLSYDHRIIDGALGGAFLRRIADLLEQFDTNRAI